MIAFAWVTLAVDERCRAAPDDKSWLSRLQGSERVPGAPVSSSERFFRGLSAFVSMEDELPGANSGDDPWLDALARLRAYAAGEAFSAPALSEDGAALRVIQLVLRSLAPVSVDERLRAARHATRAAYAESMPVLEYFAYWSLSRARRLAGTAHAAARIAAACARVVPAIWRPLLDWELLLAGGDEGSAGRALEDPAAAWRGSEERPPARGPVRFRHEQSVLWSGLSSIRPEDEALALRLANAVQGGEAQTPAVWRIGPEGCALRWSRALDPSAVTIDLQTERVADAAVALARSGETGLTLENFFAQVYGFAYVNDTHDGVLRTLLYRLRQALENVAEVQRDQGHLKLLPQTNFYCPALASAPQLEDRLLRLIALSPGLSARELAQRAGVHLRKVQRALRGLGESGACSSAKEGRQPRFYVEDTTFSEPTHFGASR